jgi:hypothetical protein
MRCNVVAINPRRMVCVNTKKRRPSPRFRASRKPAAVLPSPMRETSDKRKPAHLAVAGLWLEAHQNDEQEVDDGGSDDRAKDCFCVVGHRSSKKDPACAGSGV